MLRLVIFFPPGTGRFLTACGAAENNKRAVHRTALFIVD
jgi:hypothetical protein